MKINWKLKIATPVIATLRRCGRGNWKLLFAGRQRGFAALPVILALTALIMTAGIGIAMTGFTESMISLGSAQSSQALFYAEAGAQDALMRIARKKSYTCDSPSTGCYTIAYVNNGCSANYGCARITVSAATSPKVIVSEGRVKDNIRKTQVDVYFDSNQNGEIATTTWQEMVN